MSYTLLSTAQEWDAAFGASHGQQIGELLEHVRQSSLQMRSPDELWLGRLTQSLATFSVGAQVAAASLHAPFQDPRVREWASHAGTLLFAKEVLGTALWPFAIKWFTDSQRRQLFLNAHANLSGKLRQELLPGIGDNCFGRGTLIADAVRESAYFSLYWHIHFLIAGDPARLRLVTPFTELLLAGNPSVGLLDATTFLVLVA